MRYFITKGVGGTLESGLEILKGLDTMKDTIV